MDRRQKPGGITLSDLNNALAEAHIIEGPKHTGRYWKIRQQIAWEHRQKVMEGLKRARAEGKRIGRPPVTTQGERIGRMRERGMTWAKIGNALGIATSSAFRQYDRYLIEKGLGMASRNKLK